MAELFRNVLAISFYAAVFSALALILRMIIGNKAGKSAVCLLWGLFLLRLMLPFHFQSPVSIMNAVPEGLKDNLPVVQEMAVPEPESAAVTIDNLIQTDQTDIGTDVADHADEPDTPKAPGLDYWMLGSYIWLFGMIVMFGFTGVANINFRINLKKKQPYTEENFIRLLDACRRELNIQRKIESVRMNGTGAAAVYGFFHPRLLINPESFESLDEAAKRHVLLHELTHIKRLDPLLSLAASVLRAVHWFNPLVWLMFAAMQNDMEILCDAAVIRKIGYTEKMRYAETLLNLTEYASIKKRMPLVIAAANRPSQIKRRIKAAICIKKQIPVYTVLAILLVVAAAFAGCTAAMPGITPVSAPTPSAAIKTSPAVTSPVPSKSVTPLAEASDDAAAANRQAIEARQVKVAEYSLTLKRKSYNELFNIDKALDLLNGMWLEPGETLSINSVLGNRTVDNGWKTAPQITNGKYTESGIASICDVSSLLYAASLYADLDIVQRVAHSIKPVDIIPGLDATVSSGSPDLVIKNNKSTPIAIKTSMTESKNKAVISLEIWGDPLADGITIKIDTNIVKQSNDKTLVQCFKLFYQNGKLIKKEKCADSVYGNFPK